MIPVLIALALAGAVITMLPADMRLKAAVTLFTVAVIIPATVVLLRYGTLSPCDMLKRELREDLYARTSDDMARFLGESLFGPALDRQIDALGPARCADRLWDLHSGNGPRTATR